MHEDLNLTRMQEGKLSAFLLVEERGKLIAQRKRAFANANSKRQKKLAAFRPVLKATRKKTCPDVSAFRCSTGKVVHLNYRQSIVCNTSKEHQPRSRSNVLHSTLSYNNA